MKFYTRMNRPPMVETPAGSREKPIFTLKIDEETGRKTLIQTGTENIYEKIQENLERTKISNILARYAAGDLNALNKRPGVYEDITGAPTNLIDAHKKITEIEEAFEKLPAAIKAEFGQDPGQFIAEIINGKGLEKLQKAGAKISGNIPEPKEEKPNEQEQ